MNWLVCYNMRDVNIKKCRVSLPNHIRDPSSTLQSYRAIGNYVSHKRRQEVLTLGRKVKVEAIIVTVPTG
jgi:hypothetical protein